MKNDRSFLEGVYEKTKVLKLAQKKKPAKFSAYKRYKRSSLILAAVLLFSIITPAVYVNRSVPMIHVMVDHDVATNDAAGYAASQGEQAIAPEENVDGDGDGSESQPLSRSAPMMAAAQVPIDFSGLAKKSEVIVWAEVKKIEKSVYDKKTETITTTVALKTGDALKGKEILKSNSFKVLVNGGYYGDSDKFIPYDAFFEKGEEVLLFLNPKDDKYVLADIPNQSKYTFFQMQKDGRVYQGTNGDTINTTDLIKIIKGQAKP